MKVKAGVIVMKDGKGWGTVYEDGHSTAMGWVDLDKAGLHDERYCTKPSDVTYPGSYYLKTLEGAKIVKAVRITETFLCEDTGE